MNKVDVKKLKKQLTLNDYENIIKALNIPIMLKTKDRWVLMTGCHNRDPLSGSSKLYFYIDTKIFQCYTRCACSMDIIGLCQKRLALLDKPCTFLDAVQFIIDIANLKVDSFSRQASNVYTYDWSELEKFVRIKKGGSALTTYDKSILDQLDNILPQPWIDEGISIETMEKYKIGFYPRLNCTTIPCFNREGELIGLRCRHWMQDEIENGKYRPLSLLDGTTYKFPTNQVFYGLNYNAIAIEQNKTVWLGESEKFVQKLDSWYGEINLSLGMFGKNLGLNRRNHLLKMGVEKVIYVPDCDYIGKGDEAYAQWEKEIFSFAKQFQGYCDVEIVYDNLGLLGAKENATDRDKETWEKLFENREKIN